MIRKINKKFALGTSVVISSLLGFMFTSGRSGLVNPSDAVLSAPIFSIERASADGGDGAGDCSCSGNDGSVSPPVGGAYVIVEFLP